MKQFVFLLVTVLLFSCDKKKEQEEQVEVQAEAPKKEEKQFEMYEMSEMAALMEQMYVDNQRLKERIKSGDTIGQFPSHFMKIHSAVMTDKQENDAFFKEQAAKFIKAQEMIYKDPKNAKEHFNTGVDACIKCHEVKCSGPIPRIKKLYIQ
ncbi:hypothetical protein [Flavobacterium sp.]|uniref:hypothetical protein n=1 Tax=Flavobacterium sp. TaxID=239 RepID=UPI0028BE0209|nr:hypothetical protein [Flavobacterium sp.]